MALEPGPMQVVHNFFTTKSEVLADIDRLDLWPTVYVSNRMEELRMHPTVKPVALVADAIKDASHRGDMVLDPFCGSGTTIIAAEKTGRRAAAIEIDA